MKLALNTINQSNILIDLLYKMSYSGSPWKPLVTMWINCITWTEWTFDWECTFRNVVRVLLSVLFLVLHSCHIGARSYTYMVIWKYNCEALWSLSVETWLLLSLLINAIVLADFGDILTKAISTIKKESSECEHNIKKKTCLESWTIYHFRQFFII